MVVCGAENLPSLGVEQRVMDILPRNPMLRFIKLCDELERRVFRFLFHRRWNVHFHQHVATASNGLTRKRSLGRVDDRAIPPALKSQSTLVISFKRNENSIHEWIPCSRLSSTCCIANMNINATYHSWYLSKSSNTAHTRSMGAFISIDAPHSSGPCSLIFGRWLDISNARFSGRI